VATFQDPKVISDVLLYQCGAQWSQDRGTLTGGSYELGTVLGRITLDDDVTVAAAGAGVAGANTGNGTCTPDATTPLLAGAKAGIYTAKCIAAATNGGTFRVYDPDGLVLGDVAVGTAWASGIKFLIADGTADFAVGDGFAITVAAGSGKFTIFDPAGLDGRQYPVAVLLANVDASSDDKVGPILARGGVVDKNGLAWKAGLTDNQKAEALAQLLALGIKAVDTV
jgi:hypothetical protein